MAKASKLLNNPQSPSYAPRTPTKPNLKPYNTSASKSHSRSNQKSGGKSMTQRSKKSKGEPTKERLHTHQGSKLFSIESE